MEEGCEHRTTQTDGGREVGMAGQESGYLL